MERVFATAFAAFRARWASMLAAAFLLSYLPAAAHIAFTPHYKAASETVEILHPPPPPPATTPKANSTAQAETHAGHLGPWEMFLDAGPLVTWFPLELLCGVALTCALTSLTISSVNPEASAWRAAAIAIRRCFVPLTLITLAGSGAIILGLLAMIPGIWLMTVWAVAGPAEVAERVGVFASFRRSAVLTRGHRWPILGLLALWAAVFVVGQMLTGVIIITLGHAGNGSNISGPILGSVSSLAYDVGAAALYLELRRAKDGVGLGEVDHVFA